MSKASETKAAAKAIMDLIPPDASEAVLASVKRQVSMRLNKLRADALDNEPRRHVSLVEFDHIMYDTCYRKIENGGCIRYEMPHGELPPGQRIAADRILKSAGMDTQKCHDFARWISQEDWFMNNPNQGRALNAIPRNILTAVRFGEYLRSLEVKEITPDE